MFIAAEIGAAITGLESALCLTEAAVLGGCDAVKVQILDPDELVGVDGPVTWMNADGTVRSESMRTILRRRVLDRSGWEVLVRRAHRHDVAVVATVDFPHTLALATEVGVDALKVCSGDIAMLPWIREVATVGLPVMIDTGHATLGEVERAVDAILETGNQQIVIHHVPGGYPARTESINLRVLGTLQRMFPDVAVAFSDHTTGHDMDVAAVALGAVMVEKTLTEDRRQDGPEHMMSLEPGEVRGFVETMRTVERALGSPRRVLSADERGAKQGARRSLFTATAVQAGTGGPIVWQRPGGGIEPDRLDAVTNRRFVRDLPAGHRVEWADLA